MLFCEVAPRAQTVMPSTPGDANAAGVRFGFDGNMYGAGRPDGIYNPTRFRLTTRDGRVLLLDTTSGLVYRPQRRSHVIRL